MTPETSWKKDKQKAHATDDKQVKNQSTTAKPDAKTSVPEATQILTGYKLYLEPAENTSRVKTLGRYYQCGASTFKVIQTSKGRRKLGEIQKRPFKYEELQVIEEPDKIEYPSDGFMRKYHPTGFLTSDALALRCINAIGFRGNGRSEELAYTCSQNLYEAGQAKKGENWLHILRIGRPHSILNLKKKAQTKLKTKNIPDKKKSGKTGNGSVSNQPKKKDKQQSSTKASKNNNELKNPTIQKKAKKFLKNGGGGNKDNKECIWANLHGGVSSKDAPLFNEGQGFVQICTELFTTVLIIV
ncbi:hypothetical protein RhiirC2_721442 [Rhizophagus irregularis]|uniref:Uncharacterized protein n=1 Tax=Rhizophagus irregularis TaxID=588596 RepID=A0A2N1M639_9GLOM|nr:hypothetical protein RhiirC2_721442 [Rhizophagus irregularis]